MIYRFTCLIIFLASFLISHAQNMPVGYELKAVILSEYLYVGSTFLRTFSSNSEAVKGTPNIFKDFHKGNVYFTDKTSVSGVMLNYDCFNDNVLYSDGNQYYIINGQTIDFFTFNGEKESDDLVFKQVFIESEKKRTFLQIMYEKQSILFKRYTKELLKADFTGPYNSNRRYDEYFDDLEYYIKLPQGEICQIKPREKYIKEVFGDESSVVEKIIKTKKINLRDENDLIRLVKYYDNNLID